MTAPIAAIQNHPHHYRDDPPDEGWTESRVEPLNDARGLQHAEPF